MNRWELRELLKGTRKIKDDEIERSIYSMDVRELIEGNIEYLLARNRSNNFDIFNNSGTDRK